MFGLITKAAHERAIGIARHQSYATGRRDERENAPKPVNQQPRIDSLLGQIDGLQATIDELRPDALKHRARIARNREYDTNRRTKSPTKQGVAKAAPGKAMK